MRGLWCPSSVRKSNYTREPEELQELSQARERIRSLAKPSEATRNQSQAGMLLLLLRAVQLANCATIAQVARPTLVVVPVLIYSSSFGPFCFC